MPLSDMMREIYVSELLHPRTVSHSWFAYTWRPLEVFRRIVAFFAIRLEPTTTGTDKWSVCLHALAAPSWLICTCRIVAESSLDHYKVVRPSKEREVY